MDQVLCNGYENSLRECYFETENDCRLYECLTVSCHNYKCLE